MPAEERLPNRLIHETSPYLLQHAHNPVQWYAWGPEAFGRATQDDKPVFLSVGYSTCYWCHVMERESFENDDVAAILNQRYIAIKVDREERPDIDEQYMLAGELLTGRGGWPNSVWLTPDGKPWMAGTYFPRDQFQAVLRQLADIWKTRRAEVDRQADRLSAAIREVCSGETIAEPGRTLDRQLVDRAIAEMRASFDGVQGGFGDAPKFPPHDRLLLLAHEYRRSGDKTLLAMLTATLDAMARGGIHDQIGGGFHRYATDARWLVPHFEKMLYDNAQMLKAFSEGYLLSGDETHRDAVRGIVAWLKREMTDPGGAFYSAIDAESEHEEGKFYVWRYDEILETLGQPAGGLFAEIHGLEPGGNYVEHPSGQRPGTNILHLPSPLEQIARRKGLDPARLKSDLDAMHKRLLEVRGRRVRPHLDDKILAGWNGLMIGSLAYAGRHLKQPGYTQAALKAARFIVANMIQDGRLLRTYRAGQARLPGYLDDYAFLANGLLDLYEASDDRQWLDAAVQLARVMCQSFLDNADGGFFFTAAGHEDLLVRSKNLIGGGNLPSANAVAAQVLLRLGDITGEPESLSQQVAQPPSAVQIHRAQPRAAVPPAEYRRLAQRTLESLAGLMGRQPQGTESLILATAMSLEAPTTSRTDASPSDGHYADEQIRVEVLASRLAVRPGQTFHVAAVIDIAPGWHLYGPASETKAVTPVRVSFKPHRAVASAAAEAPQGRRAFDSAVGAMLETYEGRITFQATVTLAADAATGPTTLDVEVFAQPCGLDRCLPPVAATLPIRIEINAA